MNTMYEKPLPTVDPESAPYWSALKQHRLVLKRCLDCGRHHFYPRALCPNCHSDALEWTDARGSGSIYSFTIARRPAGPAFKADAPYVVAVVQLDEGARMMTNIVTDDVDAVRIGQRVAVQFDDVTDDITLPKFRLA